ncbi:hypothetical protein CSKR_200086 [Clonorchis sinensis]|uniref:Uncharacterized protein n=1 Tax=Clonorchis sinensis TaxID=79923 RepID=A0A8T1LZ57_CLOSI|nr:hypothetical protein CSKR_200086 [Clonorchis sinensis]
MAQWLEYEFTDREVRGSNPNSASRLSSSRPRPPGSIPALVPPSGGMEVRHRKGATREVADRKIRGLNPTFASRLPLSRLGQPGSIPAFVFINSEWRKQRGDQPLTWQKGIKEITKRLGAVGATRLPGWGAHMAANRFQWRSCCQFLSRLPELSNESWLYGSEASVLNTDVMLSMMMMMRELTGQKVQGSGPTSASWRFLLSRLGQSGSNSALVLPSADIAVRHSKGATDETLFIINQLEKIWNRLGSHNSQIPNYLKKSHYCLKAYLHIKISRYHRETLLAKPTGEYLPVNKLKNVDTKWAAEDEGDVAGPRVSRLDKDIWGGMSQAPNSKNTSVRSCAF